MIRRSDFTVSDANNTPEPGVWITVKDSNGNVAPIYNDLGASTANPFQTGAGGVFAYNIQDAAAGVYTEEYRLSLSNPAQKILNVVLQTYFQIYRFTYTSGPQTFTLPVTPTSAEVTRNGVIVDELDWSIAGAVITISGVTLFSGDSIRIRVSQTPPTGTLANYANDAAAAAGGVGIGALYRNGSVVQVRVT